MPGSDFRATLAPRDLLRMLDGDPGVRLLDVRTPGEYSTAHIRGAYNVPLDALGEHAAEIAAIGAPVVLVCQSGQRATQAETTLSASGMPHLHLLEGGMRGWTSAGLPVVRGRSRISMERQVRIAAGTLTAAGAVLALVVSPWFAILPAVVGSGLVFSGVTDTCGMGTLLGRLPYNRGGSCDTAAMVQALRQGLPPGNPAEAGILHGRDACR